MGCGKSRCEKANERQTGASERRIRRLGNGRGRERDDPRVAEGGMHSVKHSSTRSKLSSTRSALSGRAQHACRGEGARARVLEASRLTAARRREESLSCRREAFVVE